MSTRARRARRDRPNVVLINCDDLGYGDLGCYGSELNHTPAIDAMASQGVRFTDFYQASPVCSPSRAAMLTGSYPTRIGFGGPGSGGVGGVLFPGWGIGLNPNEITIASLLKGRGYATKLVGKWHCGDQPPFLPTAHGFDSYFGIPYSNDMGRQVARQGAPSIAQLGEMVRAAGGDQQMQWPPLPLLDDARVVEAQPDQAALTDRYLAESTAFLRDHRDEPFFLYFAHLYVHLPIYVQDSYLDASDNGRYGAAVACIDHAADVLLHELEVLGLDHDTVVIFTSDNGALDPRRGGSGSNGALRSWKGSTWDGGQRVPCIVRWPGVIEPAVVSDVASAIDFLPTLAALCGAAVPTDRTIDGRDLRPLLGLAAPTDDSASRPFLFIRDGDIEAIRSGRWKLHVRKRGREMCELYDVVDDVGETVDRAAEYPDIVAELQTLVADARLELGDQSLGITGSDVRPIGRIDNPQPLTQFDPDHPYFMAEYDLADRG